MALEDPYAPQSWSWVPTDWSTTPGGADLPPIEPEKKKAGSKEKVAAPIGSDPDAEIEETPHAKTMEDLAPVSVPGWPPTHWGFPMSQAVPGPPSLPAGPAPTPPGLPVPIGAQTQAEAEAALPPMQAPDVISGGEVQPGPDAISGVDARPSDVQAPTRNPEADIESADYQRANYFASHPEELAREDFKAQKAREAATNAKMLEASLRQEQEAAANYADYKQGQAVAQQKIQQLQADALALANKKIDPERWWHSRSTFQHITGVLGAIVGGMAGGYLGTGRNMAMESIEKAIDRDVEAQKEDLGNERSALGMRQSAIGQLVAQNGDVYHSAEAFRLASWEMVARRIQTEAQNFAPDGTTAREFAHQLADIRGRQQAIADARGDKAAKQYMDLAKEDREFRAMLEVSRHNRAQEAIDWAKEGREGKAAKTDDVAYTPEQLKILYPSAPVPPIPMSPKQFRGWLETGKAGEELSKAQRENSPEERNRELAVGEIVDDKGEPVRFRNVDFAGKIADTKGAVDTAAGLIDNIVRARRKYGWSSDLVKSPEWRQMQADYGALILQKKNTDQLGVLSESDMDLLGKSLGTKDPTEARDPTAGLRAARVNMVDGINARIRAQAVLPKGRSLQRYEPPSMDLPDAEPLVQEKTSVEEADAAHRGPAGQLFSFTTNEQNESRAENLPGGPTGLSPADDARVMATIATALGGETPESRADAVQRLADAASGRRSTVSSAVLGRLRGEAPSVYKAVLGKLPKAQRQEAEAFDNVPEIPGMRRTPP